MSLKPKTNPIYEDYTINKTVLGLGISGKVLACVNKQTNKKYALKVSITVARLEKSERVMCYFLLNLKTLKDTPKARREIDLQWRACQGCAYIVQIKDVYENVVQNQRVLLVVMEW